MSKQEVRVGGLVVLAIWCVACASGQSAPLAAPHGNLTAAKAADAMCTPKLVPPPPSGEGMWPWSELGEVDEAVLRARGLELPLGELWRDGEGGLLRAVVGLKGCTASFVSDDGLLLTNHHCAFGAIQRNSTAAVNLLENGFLARSRQEELDGRGMRVQVFSKESDVTEEVQRGQSSQLSDLERLLHIEAREKAIVKRCEMQPHTRCQVARNNDGLSFTLLEFLELRDVRLVAAPPRSLGDFGGEIDNWHWPRHTLDFAFLRAYVDASGRPADFAPTNRPFKPERRFKISASGVAPGDLVLVAGTPGQTVRRRTSAVVREDLEWFYPLRVELFGEWIAVLRRACSDVPASCLPTATRIKSLDNGRTNATGMIAGLERAALVERKLAEEREWRAWISSDGERAERWGGALDALLAYAEESKAGRDRDFLLKYLLSGNALLGFARAITKWATEAEKPDEQRDVGFQERDRQNTMNDLRQAQRSLHVEADRRVLAMLLARFGRLPAAQRLLALDALLGDYSPKRITRFIDALYRGSRLLDEEARLAVFGQQLDQLRRSEDKAIALALGLAQELDAWENREKARRGALSRLSPPYIESQVALRGARFYPDANGSPRISFATVTGYSPSDGISYTPFTTLAGLVAKHKGAEPFAVPPALREVAGSGPASSYANPAAGDVTVCFLSNADTTGGNSGSPALDGKGRLVGLNFDRVYENISGDYAYDPSRARNIMVDVRAILFYLDEVLGADALLAELGIPSGRR